MHVRCRSEPVEEELSDLAEDDVAVNESDEEAATDVERRESNRAASTQGASCCSRAAHLLAAWQGDISQCRRYPWTLEHMQHAQAIADWSSALQASQHQLEQQRQVQNTPHMQVSRSA